jgi:hypothetical protein
MCLVDFIIKKFVMLHSHMNVKKKFLLSDAVLALKNAV